jgi:hypothetical protein
MFRYYKFLSRKLSERKEVLVQYYQRKFQVKAQKCLLFIWRRIITIFSFILNLRFVLILRHPSHVFGTVRFLRSILHAILH